MPIGNSNNNSELLELRVNIVDADVIKTVPLNPESPIYQICEDIRKSVREAQTKSPKSYGLFLPHEDPRKGLWLDNTKTLQHYIIRRLDTIEYRSRTRWLSIKTLDDVSKMLKVDDSWTVAELMLTVCSKLCIYNYDEYSLIREDTCETPMSPVGEKTLSFNAGNTNQSNSGTSRRNHGTLSRDQEKLDKLKRKYHTEDGLNWLNPSQTLRQQGIQEREVLLLKRKYFFSDMNVDSRDPIQLNLLYIQLKDAVINGTHPVTVDEATHLAGIQSQVQFGNFSSDKFKSGFLDLREFLPKEYLKGSRGVEKKIFNHHAKYTGLTDVEAKEKYCLLCRSLKTYGITFFLVKEKVIGKNKLIPRLLGVNKDCVIQVDEKTKEIINKWPLTSIKKWAASFNAFTLDFGEYSPDGYYTAQTDKGEKISQLIAGYIDIILKRKKAKDHLGVDADEESVMIEDNISPLRAVIVEHVPKAPRLNSDDDVVTRKSLKTTSSVRYSSQASDSITSQDAMDMITPEEAQFISRQFSSLSRTQSPDSSIITSTSQYPPSMDGTYKNKQYLISLQENLRSIETYKDQLVMPPQSMTVTQDEETMKWLRVNLDNSHQRLSDEIGAMNAAVAQVLRSAQGLTTIEEESQMENESDEMTDVDRAHQLAIMKQERQDDTIAQMQNSFSIIAVHLPSLMEEIKTASYYQNQIGSQEPEEQSGEDLIEAAKRLAEAFTNLIKAAYPVEENTRNVDKKAILEAATEVGKVSSEFLTCITEQETCYEELKVERPQSIIFLTDEEKMYKEKLLQLAKAVANATSDLIKEVKVVAVQPCNDTDNQKKMVKAATETGQSISQLIATTKIVAPTIDQPVCQEQLVLCVQDVQQSILGVVASVDDSSGNVNESANDVELALQALLHHINRDNDKSKNLDQFMEAYEYVLTLENRTEYSDDTLNNNTMEISSSSNQQGDTLIEASRKLAQATAGMISEIKVDLQKKEASTNTIDNQMNDVGVGMDEEDSNPEEKEKVVKAVRQLTEATSTLVDSAKNCTAAPEQMELRYTLREAAHKFIIVTYKTECADLLQQQVVDNLLSAARKAATTGTHLINCSQSAAKKSRASNYKVCNDGQELSNQIPKMIVAIKEARRDPKDQLVQLELISVCEEFIEPSEQLCQSSKYLWPTVTDTALQRTLDQSIVQSVTATDELRKYCHQAKLICQHLDLEAALKQLERSKSHLESIKKSVAQGCLIPLPDDKAEESTAQLIRAVKQTSQAANHLKLNLDDRYLTYDRTKVDKYKHLENMDDVGRQAKELSSSLSRLVQAARGVAASIELESRDNRDQYDTINSQLVSSDNVEKEAQIKIIDSCLSAVDAAHDFVMEAKLSPEDRDQLKRIQEEVERLSDSLTRCFESLPGQRDLDMLAKHVDKKKHQFIDNELSPNGTLNSQDKTENDMIGLPGAVFELNQAVTDLVSSQSLNNLHNACRKYRKSYDKVLDSTNTIINNDQQNPSDEYTKQRPMSINKIDNIRQEVVDLSDCSLVLFDKAKLINNSIEEDNLRNRHELQDAAKMVIEAINKLLASTSSSYRPGRKECDKAIMKMESIRPILDNPVYPISQKDYYGCLDFIVEKTMPPLASSLKSIPYAVKDEDSPKFIDAVYGCADSICLLLEETAQAAYLIGIGDGSSKLGKRGLADHTMFIQIRNKIYTDCQKLQKIQEPYSMDVIIKTAANIAEQTKKLCETSKTVMSTHPNDRTKVSEFTKAALMSVSELVTSVQQMTKSNDFDDEIVVGKAKNVDNSTTDLVDLLMSYQYAGEEPVISDEAKDAQGPLKAAGITVLDSAIEVVQAAKELLVAEPTENCFLTYSSSCKDLNDSLKHLTSTIRESAPGQKECDATLLLIENMLRQVQETKMKVMKQRSKSSTWDSETEESYQKIIQSALLQMPHCVDSLSKAGKSHAEELAHNLNRLTQLLESINNSCLSASKHTELVQNSTIYLEHAATILEANEQFVKAIKTSGGNPKAVNAHSQINEMAQCVKDSCEDLLAALDRLSVKDENVKYIVENITQSSFKVQEASIMPQNAKFGDTQSRMLELCYKMDDITSDIGTNASHESTLRLLSPLSVQLTQKYDDLCKECKNAISVIPDNLKSRNLQEHVKYVGDSSVALVKTTADNNKLSLPLMQAKVKDLHARIDEVIQILIDANNQTQRCNEALKILKAVKKDVDMTKLFAKENQPNGTSGKTGTGNLIMKTKDSITTNANSIVTNIKAIVTSNDNTRLLSDNSLNIASNTQIMSLDLIGLIQQLKQLDESKTPISLLDRLNDVLEYLIKQTETCRDLCEPTTARNVPQNQLQDRGKDSVNAITELLKEFKVVEEATLNDYGLIDEAVKSIENIRDNIKVTLDNSIKAESPANSRASSTMKLSSASDNFNVTSQHRFAAEEMNRMLPILSNGATKVLEMLQQNDQRSLDDINAVTKYCVRVNEDMKNCCENLLKNPPYNEPKLNAVSTSKEVSDSYIDLLKDLKHHLKNPSKNSQTQLVNTAKKISDLIKLLYQRVESLKEGPRLVMYFRPSSPEWRDVSEKFIGRHVAYHHCYVKSYKHGSHTSLHHHTPPNSPILQIPLNSQNPSNTDLDNAKKQIRYVTTKLIHITPHKNLIGKNKYSVSEIDQMLSYVHNIGKSTEILLASSQQVKNNDTSPAGDQGSDNNIFKSAIGVANAMKNLCEATKIALTTGKMPMTNNLNNGSEINNPISMATKEISASTQQLISAFSGSNYSDIEACGKQIAEQTDLLLHHMANIGTNRNLTSDELNVVKTNGNNNDNNNVVKDFA